jgi:hopanoid biosynthesis associated protein HpnK
MRQVVITADDLGIAVETNRAVEVAHREGILTSASIMTNMPAFADAVAVLRRNPGLGTGVHLVLTSGRAVLSPDRIPLLVDRDGIFRYGYVALSRLMIGPSRAAALLQIREELRAQIEKAAQAGLEIDHIDGHRHVHMIPAIWPLVVALGRERGVVVRNSRERLGWDQWRRDRAKNLVATLVLRAFARANETVAVPQIQFTGLLDSGCVNVRVLRRLLRDLPAGTSEIVTHPSFAIASESRLCCSTEDALFLKSRGRVSELAALVNVKLRHLLDAEGLETVSFRRYMPASASSSAASTC